MRGFLLASVSALTLFAGIQAARAEEGMKFIFGASGGLVYGPNSTVDAFVDSGAYDITSIDIPGLEGNYFAVTVGAEVMPLWDIRAKLAATHIEPTYTEFDYLDGSDKLGAIGTGLDYQTLDLEVGYTPVIDDNFELRFVTGVRALHYTDRLEVRDKIGTDNESRNVYENEFVGAGPRVAIEASNRFDGTPFGLSASAGGSVIFGTLETSTNGTEPVDSEKTIVSLEGRVGVDYYLGEIGKITAGYRGEVFSGMHDFEEAVSPLEANHLTHGPVLEFLGKF